jgi:hypothetical protein
VSSMFNFDAEAGSPEKYQSNVRGGGLIWYRPVP